MKYLKALIPPVIWQLLPNKAMKEYDNYDSALADSHTYEDPGVIKIVSSKTEAFRNALLEVKDKTVNDRQVIQNMFVLSHVWRNRPLDVLEIGGACGASYFELSHLLPGKINSWHIVETPAMAAAGRRLFQDNRLAFFEDLNTATSKLGTLDLLIAQGVLQYLKEPLQTLETLLNLGFKYTYITRTVVGYGIKRPIVTKQVANLSAHGPGTAPKGFGDRQTSQPLTILPFESITSRISGGYNVLYQFIESYNVSMPIGSWVIKTKTVGFLLEKASQ